MTVAKDITACHVVIYLEAKSIVLLVLISTVYYSVVSVLEIFVFCC